MPTSLPTQPPLVPHPWVQRAGTLICSLVCTTILQGSPTPCQGSQSAAALGPSGPTLRRLSGGGGCLKRPLGLDPLEVTTLKLCPRVWKILGMTAARGAAHQQADPATVGRSSGLLQAHQPHPLQLAPVCGIWLPAGSLGPRASSRVGQQHGGQLAVHISQLLRLYHTFPYWRSRRGRVGAMCGVPAEPVAGPQSLFTEIFRRGSALCHSTDKDGDSGPDPSQQLPFTVPET